MKAQIKVGNLVVEAEGSTQEDLFMEVASVHEVFGETHCGLCNSNNVRPNVRVATVQKGKKLETYTYCEMQCCSCGASLSYGKRNDDTGRLFPKRKLDDKGKPDLENGDYGKHRGWTKYRGGGERSE